MSKYDPLWDCLQRDGSRSLKLACDEMKDIAGIAIDQSFLNYKK